MIKMYATIWIEIMNLLGTNWFLDPRDLSILHIPQIITVQDRSRDIYTKTLVIFPFLYSS